MNIVLTYACRLPVSQVTRYLLYCEKVLKVHSVFINVIRVGTHFLTVLTFVSSIRLTVGLHYSLNKHMVQFRKNSKTAALLLIKHLDLSNIYSWWFNLLIVYIESWLFVIIQIRDVYILSLFKCNGIGEIKTNQTKIQTQAPWTLVRCSPCPRT